MDFGLRATRDADPELTNSFERRRCFRTHQEHSNLFTLKESMEKLKTQLSHVTVIVSLYKITRRH